MCRQTIAWQRYRRRSRGRRFESVVCGLFGLWHGSTVCGLFSLWHENNVCGHCSLWHLFVPRVCEVIVHGVRHVNAVFRSAHARRARRCDRVAEGLQPCVPSSLALVSPAPLVWVLWNCAVASRD